MFDFNNFRSWLSSNLAPVVFLMAYFFTVVLGNLMYLLPGARPYLDMATYTSRIFAFNTLFSGGYWLLLLLPFVVTPVTVWVVRRVAQKPMGKVISFFPEFSRTSYLVLFVACYGWVSYALWHAGAFKLFLEGSDFNSSVEARFQIRERVGFFSTVILMSNLHFLSLFSAVKFVRNGGYWWGTVTIVNVVLISLLLISLNMKWPIIIFYAGLVMVIFVYTRQHPLIKTIIGMAFLILVYFLISAFVYRLAPSNISSVQSTISLSDQTSTTVDEPIKDIETGTKIVRLSGAIGEHIPMMLFHAVNRMAINYPYYYEVFTSRGQVCGGLMAQAKIGQKCRPSYFIYSEMFNDQFNGRGTAPAAVHISAYALGGWPLAFFGLICASIVLGLFATLPMTANASIGALAITGGIAGYHFSQLPGEGPIFYDHGVFWTILMLWGYALFVKLRRLFSKK